MDKKFLLGLVLVCFASLSVRAADGLDEKQFQKLMKEVGKVAKEFKTNLEAKNADALIKDSSRVGEIYGQMSGFWKSRSAEDAAKWSTESSTAAAATASAAKAQDWDKTKQHWNAVMKNCKSCHDARREKLDDGSYRIK
jgi:cytochrome c556